MRNLSIRSDLDLNVGIFVTFTNVAVSELCLRHAVMFIVFQI